MSVSTESKGIQSVSTIKSLQAQFQKMSVSIEPEDIQPVSSIKSLPEQLQKRSESIELKDIQFQTKSSSSLKHKATRTVSREFTYQAALEIKQRADLGQRLILMKEERLVMYAALQKHMPRLNQLAGPSSNARAINELQDVASRVSAYGPYLKQLREQNLSGRLSIEKVDAELRLAHDCLAWIREIELPRLCGHNVGGFGKHPLAPCGSNSSSSSNENHLKKINV